MNTKGNGFILFMSQTFIKKVEDFVCEKCGKFVMGDGYTNHCPECLYSKHVDVNPGDRASDCLGLMKVMKVENEKGEWILTHQCEKCGHEKRNKVGKQDSFEAIAQICKKLF